MSEDTKQNERIIKLETKFELMFEQNKLEHQDIKESLDRVNETLSGMVEKLDKRYAPIYVKNIMIWSGSIIGSFLILFALSKLFI